MSDTSDPAAYVATIVTLYVELRNSPIGSLACFRPVIDELRAHPAPESYLDYLRLKLRRAATRLSAKVKKSTFSDDR